MSTLGNLSTLQMRKATDSGLLENRPGSRSRSSSRGPDQGRGLGTPKFGSSRPYDDTSVLSGENPKNESEFLTKQEVLSIVARFLMTKEFIVESYQFKEVGGASPRLSTTSPGGYFRLEVAIKDVDGSKREFPFFVKKLPKDSNEVKTRTFAKETDAYSTLFVDFNKLLKDEKNPRMFKSTYYFVRPGRVLVLEDLASKGFYQIGKRDYLDKEHLIAVMKSLATFHAASIKFEDKLSKGMISPSVAGYEKAPPDVKRTVADVYTALSDGDPKDPLLKSHPDASFVEFGLKGLLELVDHLPGYARHELDQIKIQLPNIVGGILDWLKPSTRYHNVFTHGNLCTNNIFFRRNEDNSLEAILVDFQNLRYAPPALDVLMLLHLNQRLVFRMKEKHVLLQTYWNMFAEELAKGGVCPQKILPVNDFLKSCEEFTRWAILYSPIYLLTYLLTEEPAAEDPDAPPTKTFAERRNEQIEHCFTKDGTYNIRMTETTNEMIRTFMKM